MKTHPFRIATLMLTTAGAALGVPSAFAADPASDFYVGGTLVLQSTTSLGGNIDAALASQGVTSTSTASKSGTSPGFRAGYRFSPNLAVEATYDQVGSLNVSSAVSAPAADSAVGGWKSRGLGLHVLGIAPIDKDWSLYGRLGMENWRTSANLASNAGGTTGLSTNATNWGLVLGAGASYAVSRNLDATAELTRYSNVGVQNTTGRTNVNALSLGVLYHFL